MEDVAMDGPVPFLNKRIIFHLDCNGISEFSRIADVRAGLTQSGDINLIFMLLVVSDACDGHSLGFGHKTSAKATRRREAGSRTSLLGAEYREWRDSFATRFYSTETSEPVWKAQHHGHKSKKGTATVRIAITINDAKHVGCARVVMRRKSRSTGC